MVDSNLIFKIFILFVIISTIIYYLLYFSCKLHSMHNNMSLIFLKKMTNVFGYFFVLSIFIIISLIVHNYVIRYV